MLLCKRFFMFKCKKNLVKCNSYHYFNSMLFKLGKNEKKIYKEILEEKYNVKKGKIFMNNIISKIYHYLML